MLLLCGNALLASAEQRRTAGTIAYFDPDANYSAIETIMGLFNRFLASSGLQGLSLQPVQSVERFEELLRARETRFALVSAAYVKAATGQLLRPLLVPTHGGEVFYSKALFDTRQGTATSKSLDGKTIAVTLAGGDPHVGIKTVLGRLKNEGVSVEGCRIIPVPKDLDALLALSFGQVDAALVAPLSVEVMRRINPAAVKRLRKLHEAKPVLRPPLCQVAERPSSGEVRALLEALGKMARNELGRKALDFLGIDGWVPYREEMLK